MCTTITDHAGHPVAVGDFVRYHGSQAVDLAAALAASDDLYDAAPAKESTCD